MLSAGGELAVQGRVQINAVQGAKKRMRSGGGSVLFK